MMIKEILNNILPGIYNRKSNKKLKKQLEMLENDIDLQKEFCLELTEQNSVENTVEKIQDSEIRRKSILEDKAKTNVIGITIAITLVMGAYGLCNDVYGKTSSSFIEWIVFILFVIAALFMILAGIISIATIIDENIVFLPLNNGIGLSENDLIKKLNICIGKNRIQNLIRNNNIYTSYQYIKNALICLFIVLVLSIFPISRVKTDVISSPPTGQYYYSDLAVNFMLENHPNNEVSAIIHEYINSIDKSHKDGTYGFVAENKNLFIKISIENEKVNVLLIEQLTNVDER